MKKVVYLAPIFLLSLLGKGVMADQVEHVSRLDGAFSQIEQDAKLAPNASNMPQEASNKQVANFAVNDIKATNLTTSFATEKTESNALAQIIVSSQNATVHVNYVDADNGDEIIDSGYDIDLTEGSGQYDNIPEGYELVNNGYNVKTNRHTQPVRAKTHQETYQSGTRTSYSFSGLTGPGLDDIANQGVDKIEAMGGAETGQGASGTLGGVSDWWFYNGDELVGEYSLWESDDNVHNDWADSSVVPSLECLKELQAGTEANYVYTRTGTSEPVYSTRTVVDSPAHVENVIDNYVFSDQSGQAKVVNSNTINVTLRHQIKTIDANSSSFNTNASNNLFVINGSSDAKMLLKSQTRNFKAAGLLDLVTNTAQMQGNWQPTTNPQFDTIETGIPIGYDQLNSNLLTLSL